MLSCLDISVCWAECCDAYAMCSAQYVLQVIPVDVVLTSLYSGLSAVPIAVAALERCRPC